MPSSNAPAGLGQLVGSRYRLLHVLGEGGMKRVFAAEDTKLNNRACAVAELLDATTDRAQRQANRAGFEREADLLLELDNEYIPKVLDRFSDGNLHYLVMELVPGMNLEQCVARAGGRIDQSAALDFAAQILRALHYLHSQSPPIVFRDLKPDNVMITPEKRIKLIDFGIARHFTKARGTMIGTQGYAAPEQYKGQVDPRSDIYAFGALMHRILSGRDPQSEPPFSFPPILSRCPTINPRLARLIDRCLSTDADKRPRTTLEIVTEIEAIGLTSAGQRSAVIHAVSQAPTSCKQVFDTMPSRFNKDAAKGLSAVYEFDLSGDGGGNWHVIIEDQAIEVNTGRHPSPNVTISMAAQDYLDMMAGKLNAQVAFMSGRLHMSGDMSLALMMQRLFQS